MSTGPRPSGEILGASISRPQTQDDLISIKAHQSLAHIIATGSRSGEPSPEPNGGNRTLSSRLRSRLASNREAFEGPADETFYMFAPKSDCDEEANRDLDGRQARATAIIHLSVTILPQVLKYAPC